MSAIRAVSGCRLRTHGIEAAWRDLIMQSSCYIAYPHSQYRIAIIVKCIISFYIQNFYSTSDERRRLEERGEESNQLIYQSFIIWEEGGNRGVRY